MRSLDEVLAELKAAEKEYAEKCLKYGIEEKHKRKKNEEVPVDENGNPVEQVEPITENNVEEANN